MNYFYDYNKKSDILLLPPLERCQEAELDVTQVEEAFQCRVTPNTLHHFPWNFLSRGQRLQLMAERDNSR